MLGLWFCNKSFLPIQILGRGQASSPALESSPWSISRYRMYLGSYIETPPLLRALKRGQSWILDPASSTGAQSGNVPFREDIVKSVIRTTVLASHSHPLISPSLEIVNGDKSWPSSQEALPRARVSMRNRREHMNPQQEAPNLFRQEPLLQIPPRYVKGGILRNASLVHTSQMILPNREVCGVQTQSGNGQDRPIAVLADPHSWQGSHPSSHPPSDTPKSLLMDNLEGIPYQEDKQDILLALLFSSVEDPLLTQERVPLVFQVRVLQTPLASQEEVPQLPLDPLVEVLLGHLDPLVDVPGPSLRRWFFRTPNDLKVHPDLHSCGNSGSH